MLPSVSAIRPADVLRRSSDQIRRVAQILADITDEAAEDHAGRFAVLFPGQVPPDVEDINALRQSTILTAQRAFSASLRLAQDEDRREPPLPSPPV